MNRLLVIGLDSASPELLFGKFGDQLPCLNRLREKSIYGRLISCIPPITIPAWLVMMTGKSPGELGLYGFRHRKRHSYTDMWIANSLAVKAPAVWDILGEEGKRVCLVGIPPSYPPFSIPGYLISCFITPDADKDYTHPPELKQEIEGLVGQYVFDVPFRRDDRDALLQEIYDMSRKRFRVIKYLLQNKEWDFFAFMEIGVDRIHHAFWKYFDPAHHLYQSSPFQSVIPDYYRYLDEEIGDLLSLLPAQTSVLIVSDHGVKRMKGAFCLNEWLVTEGYLVLKTTPPHQLGLEQADVDWGRTTAWGWGGYYARIFLNVQGREPQGVIKPEDYECFRDELAQKLQQIRGPQGEEWKTRIFKPQEIYPQTKGDCPDLMVYFDDLYWRSAGTLGHNALYLPENDTGPDDAVHSEDGIFLLYNDQQNQPRELDATIYDIAPTILHLMSAPIPPLLPGESLLWKLEQGLLPKQSPGE